VAGAVLLLGATAGLDELAGADDDELDDEPQPAARATQISAAAT
jgi:hypothetical protein